MRRTLSFSLHEMASIFGAKMCEEHLLSTFELFLEDLDQVRRSSCTKLSISDFCSCYCFVCHILTHFVLPSPHPPSPLSPSLVRSLTLSLSLTHTHTLSFTLSHSNSQMRIHIISGDKGKRRSRSPFFSIRWSSFTWHSQQIHNEYWSNHIRVGELEVS